MDGDTLFSTTTLEPDPWFRTLGPVLSPLLHEDLGVRCLGWRRAGFGWRSWSFFMAVIWMIPLLAVSIFFCYCKIIVRWVDDKVAARTVLHRNVRLLALRLYVRGILYQLYITPHVFAGSTRYLLLQWKVGVMAGTAS